MKARNYIVSSIGQFVMVVAILLFFVSLKSHAQITPASLFSNGAVLQRNVEIPIWGTADVGSEITVSINGISNTATSNDDEKWTVVLPAMDAGGPFEMVISSSSTTKTLSEIYIGDVWLASGQSNMELKVSQADDATAQIAAANSQFIREFKIPKSTADVPSDEIPSNSVWRSATSDNVGNFSATAYYFAKNLQPEIGVPIGIINNSYGGARIEAYMSEDMLGFDEEVVLAGGTYRERQPTVLFNKMLKPIINYPIKGFLWYQGESNADSMDDALEYGSLFKKMIKGWRQLWGMGDLPFLWVQLPNQGEVSSDASGWDAWPQLRACQTRALELPATGEAITIDVGDVDIHPTNKIPVGERLALLARKVAYNEEIVDQGPRYKSHTLDGNKVIIDFDHIGSGLVSKNSNNGVLNGFAIGTSNSDMVWADAVIEGNTVIVSSSSVTAPVVVSYAWQYNPQNLNFYNIEAIPAAPFRMNVVDPGFTVKAFNVSATNIERGQFSVLSWEVYGSSEITINNEEVDPISGMRVVPIETTTYSLEAIDSNNPSESIVREITIEVVDPKPTISIRTDVGGVADPESEVTIIANANPPSGGSITKVELFVDGESIATLTEKPYEVVWTTPSEIGNYVITGVVTDNKGYEVTSSPVTINVLKMKLIIYEAEDASYTGTGSVKSNTQASGDKYVDLQSGWVLTFDEVEVDEAGTYPLTIRYLLNYEGPKAQLFIVNGENLGEITFEAPDNSTWMSYKRDVELKVGKNTIEFGESWGWMSFDYIAIAVEDTSTVSSKKIGMNGLELENYPNPFQSKTTLSYTLVDSENVELSIYNGLGCKIETLVDEVQLAGKYEVSFDASKFKSGLYFAKMLVNADYTTKKLFLIR